MAAKKILHIDDSVLSRKTVKTAVCSKFTDIDFTQCESFFQFKQVLSEQGRDISLIITDLVMVGCSGFEIIEWIKSHPLYHHIPMLVLSAESGQEVILKAKKKGALHCLKKPYSPEDIHHMISTYSFDFDEAQSKEFDNIFVENAMVTIEEITRALSLKNENLESSILQNLHKLKGDALTGQWPLVAYFIHDIEDIWSFCKTAKTTGVKQLHDVTSDAMIVLLNMLNDIKEGKPHRQCPHDFHENVKHLKHSVEKGWTQSVSLDQDFSTPDSQKQSHTNSKDQVLSFGPYSNDSIRVSREKLDDAYAQIKKISQLRNKMSLYTNQLKQEFSDEPFINDLHKMILELGTESNLLTEFILKLRAKELKIFFENIRLIVKQCSQQLNKVAQLKIHGDDSILIDSSVLQVLESLFGHLIRNSLDHGLESKEERIKKGKNEEGLLNIDVTIKKQHNDMDDWLVIRFQDDGSGVDFQGLRTKLAALNLMSASQINTLTEKQLIDFIFMDAVSTKEKASLYSGRGVGLSLIKKALQDIGGTITVETGSWGTCFEIHVPRFFRM